VCAHTRCGIRLRLKHHQEAADIWFMESDRVDLLAAMAIRCHGSV